MLPRYQLLKLLATVTSGFRGQVVQEGASPQTVEIGDYGVSTAVSGSEQRLGL